MEKADGGQSRDKTDDAGNHDEAPIVLGGQAIENLKHDGSEAI
jgi:hypothetical protein